MIPSIWEIQLVVVILRTISQERKKRSVPSHVKYKVDVSEYHFDKKATAPNLEDSISDNSGSDAGREKESMREL